MVYFMEKSILKWSVWGYPPGLETSKCINPAETQPFASMSLKASAWTKTSWPQQSATPTWPRLAARDATTDAECGPWARNGYYRRKQSQTGAGHSNYSRFLSPQNCEEKVTQLGQFSQKILRPSWGFLGVLKDRLLRPSWPFPFE